MSALHAFPGGLCLPANKERSTALPIQQAPLAQRYICLLYTSPSPRDRQKSRMPSSA